MLSNTSIIMIIIASACLIYWLQRCSNKDKKEKKSNMFDKLKIPLLVSSIIGIVYLLNNDNSKTNIVSVQAVLSNEFEPTSINQKIYTDQPDF